MNSISGPQIMQVSSVPPEVIHPSIHQSETFHNWARRRNFIAFKRKDLDWIILAKKVNPPVFHMYLIREKDLFKAKKVELIHRMNWKSHPPREFIKELYKKKEDIVAYEFWNSLNNLEFNLEPLDGNS